MGETRENQAADWELSEDYYKEDKSRRELKLEDFMEEEKPQPETTGQTGSQNADVQRVAADVRRVKELAGQGKTMAEIASLMGVGQQYVSDIQICVQSFPEDNDIAVAHLILMG